MDLQNIMEGSRVLEQLARIGQVDEFMAAVDSQNLQQTQILMRQANIDALTIKRIQARIMDEFDEA